MPCCVLAAVEMEISAGHVWRAAAEMKIPLAGSPAQAGGKC